VSEEPLPAVGHSANKRDQFLPGMDLTDSLSPFGFGVFCDILTKQTLPPPPPYGGLKVGDWGDANQSLKVEERAPGY
jgi:hypothetical protein